MVYAAGELLARVEGGEVRWEHRQPATGGCWESAPSGAAWALTELDPLGADLGTESPYQPGIAPAEPAVFDAGSHWGSRAGSPYDPRSGCAVNGMELPCEVFLRMVDDDVINYLTDDPRGGAGPHEAPARRVGAGSAVWVGLGTRRMPGVTEGEWPTDDEEAVKTDSTLRRMGFFIHLPVGGAGQTAVAPNPQQNELLGLQIHAESLRKGVEELLNSGDCASYVTSLLEKLSVAHPLGGDKAFTDPLKLFNAVAEQGGFVFVPNLTLKNSDGEQMRALGTVSGLISNKRATVYISAQIQSWARIALHEIIHLAGKYQPYEDRMVAVQASALPGAPKLEEGKDTRYYSSYWDGELSKHCPGR